MRYCPSTASVYPQGAAVAFDMAESLGYDGVEVMVWTDPVSQDIGMVEDLAQQHRLPGVVDPRAVPAHHPTRMVARSLGAPHPYRRRSTAPRRADRRRPPPVPLAA